MKPLALCLLFLLGGCATVVPTYEDALTAGIFLEPASRAVLPAGVSIRPVHQAGLEVTKVSEGFRSRLYNDVAHYCTIAYGHLIKKAPCDGSEPPAFLDGITEPEGEDLLVRDLRIAQIAVMTNVTTSLTDGQYAALCDFVYNVGTANFQKSELLRAVNMEEFHRVPTQLRRWIMAGGRVIEGLKNRRSREIALFFEGMPTPRTAPSAGEDVSLLDIRKGEGE
jgi:GH24 family phage-related lysozyme (muramidase)